MANPPSKTPAKTPYTGKKRGPPKGSCNAFRHGLKSGSLPRSCRYIQWRLDALRRILEQAILANATEVTIQQAAAIITIMRWEKAAQLHRAALPVGPGKVSRQSGQGGRCQREAGQGTGRSAPRPRHDA